MIIFEEILPFQLQVLLRKKFLFSRDLKCLLSLFSKNHQLPTFHIFVDNLILSFISEKIRYLLTTIYFCGMIAFHPFSFSVSTSSSYFLFNVGRILCFLSEGNFKKDTGNVKDILNI